MGDLSIVTVSANGCAVRWAVAVLVEMGDTKLDDKAVESLPRDERRIRRDADDELLVTTARAGVGGLYDYACRWASTRHDYGFDQMGYKLVGAAKPVKKDRCLPANGSPMVSWTPKNGEQRTSTRRSVFLMHVDQTTGQ